MWTADDVLFAPVRASRRDATEIARDLLSAADNPARLDGVSPPQARACAAEILFAAGDVAAALAAAALGARPLRATQAELRPHQLMVLTLIFAAAGDEDRAVTIAAGVPGTAKRRVGDPRPALEWHQVALKVAVAGRFELALRICDAATPWPGPDSLSYVNATPHSRELWLAKVTKQQVLRLKAIDEIYSGPVNHVASDGAGSPQPGEHATELPAWPVVVNGCLGWWREPEHARIIRQIPELGGVLGDPWRQHTSRTETALRACSQGGEHSLSLIALGVLEFADFLESVDYLTSTRADPGDAKVLTAFGEMSRQAFSPRDARQGSRRTPMRHLGGTMLRMVGVQQRLTPWPPQDRDRCWCGSGKRYRDCCRLY